MNDSEEAKKEETKISANSESQKILSQDDMDCLLYRSGSGLLHPFEKIADGLIIETNFLKVYKQDKQLRFEFEKFLIIFSSSAYIIKEEKPCIFLGKNIFYLYCFMKDIKKIPSEKLNDFCIRKILYWLPDDCFDMIKENFLEEDTELKKLFEKNQFKIEDLLIYDNITAQKILRQIDIKDIAKIYNFIPEEIRDKICKNISKRTFIVMQDESQYYKDTIETDIKIVTRKIFNIIRELQKKGEIEDIYQSPPCQKKQKISEKVEINPELYKIKSSTGIELKLKHKLLMIFALIMSMFNIPKTLKTTSTFFYLLHIFNTIMLTGMLIVITIIEYKQKKTKQKEMNKE